MIRTTKNSRYRERLAYHGGLLGVMALLASAALVIGNLETRDDIAQRLDEDMQASLRQVIPPNLYDNDPLQDSVLIAPLNNNAGNHNGVRVFRARRQGRVVAVAFQIKASGYGGVVNLIMGVNRKGEILGVRVISHAETPGLGDKIETQKSDWILGFNGRSLRKPDPAGWKVRKDGGRFDQFSGATITPRAVIKAIKQGLQFFAGHQQTLLSEDDDR